MDVDKAMKRMTAISVVVRTLRVLEIMFKEFVDEIKIDMRVDHARKTTLLGTVWILRLLLGS